LATGGEAAPPSSAAPLLAGYMTKRGAIRKNWLRRFFILTDAHLVYYEREREEGPAGDGQPNVEPSPSPTGATDDGCAGEREKGRIDLTTVLAVERVGDTEGNSTDQRHPWRFAVISTDRRLVLSAEGEEARERWEQAIEQARLAARARARSAAAGVGQGAASAPSSPMPRLTRAKSVGARAAGLLSPRSRHRESERPTDSAEDRERDRRALDLAAAAPRRSSVRAALADEPAPPETGEPMPLPTTERRAALEWTKRTLVSRDSPHLHYRVDDGRSGSAAVLGKGGFSSVYRGTDVATGRPVAIKKMTIDRKNHPSFLLIETELHAKSAHPHIVQFIDSFHLPAKDEFWIVLELIDGCTVQDLVMLDGGFNEPHVSYVISCVTSALVYIHSLNRIHRDIKMQNVLCSRKGVVKLTDFGLAAQLTAAKSKRSSVVGTPDALPPEILRHRAYGTEVDVWSLGVLVLKCVRQRPYDADVRPKELLRLMERSTPPRLRGTKYTAAAKSFVSACLRYDPAERPTARELASHPWFDSSLQATPAELARVVDKVKGSGGGCVIS